jgi:general secretion pathway protein I
LGARQRGFTLLEVLVAFIIAAFALGLLFEGGIGGLASATTALRYEEALSRAQSHLAAASLGSELTASDRQGDEGQGYHWRVRVTPVRQAAGVDPTKPVAALFAVGVEISWQEGHGTRRVTLQSQAVGTAPPPPP